MNSKELQTISADIVKKIDNKCGLKRDEQLTVAQLIEELGELVHETNLKRLRNANPQKECLEEEFADVYFQLASLADLFGVDIEKSVLHKITILKKRHNL